MKPSSQEPAAGGNGAGSGGAKAAAPTGGAGNAGMSTAGARTSGGSAIDSAGAGPEPIPTAQIAGRWAMFNFEDPVGVQLVQAGNVLTGQGCAAGAPPLAGIPNFCGAINGEVVGDAATFGFLFAPNASYRAETTVSNDGQRMTGRLHTLHFLDYPTAWLRLTDDQVFLPQDERATDEPLSGAYEMKVISASRGASEYAVGQVYRLNYFRHGISGDLGSFWHSESTDPAAGSPVRVGPVAETAPELPTTLELDFQQNNFTEIRASTTAGSSYTFRASRAVP